MFERRVLLIAFVWAWTESCVSGSLSCVGEDGVAVDWWLALKAPGIDIHGNTKYAYLDSSSAVKDGKYVWREGSQISGSGDNPPANTLTPLYNYNLSASSRAGHVMWNDDPPESHCPNDCYSYILAHSKGVLAFSASGGFLLSHSVPKFPDSPKDAQAFSGIKPGQLLNGQSFLCVSLDPEGLEAVAGALTTADLYIYSPWIPADLAPQYPNIRTLARDALAPYGPVKAMTTTASVRLGTKAGAQLQMFAKSSTGFLGEEVRMWEDIVEHELRSSMLVQTWPEGGRRDFPSFCGPPASEFDSRIITKIDVPETRLTWPTRAKGRYHDHSKWAITALASHGEAEVFCAGDNNRAVHQSVRGGTAVCFTNSAPLHGAVHAAVAGVGPCRSRRSAASTNAC